MMLQKKKNGGGNGNNKENEDSTITVVLKVEMHCDGCASKIIKHLRCFQGYTCFHTLMKLISFSPVLFMDLSGI